MSWPSHAFDRPVEIVPNLWLSPLAFTIDLPLWAVRRGFTHLVNVAGQGDAKNKLEGCDKPPYYRSNPENLGLRYLELQAEDSLSFNILPALHCSFPFIKEAISSGGKVLVHCFWGQSRSASVVAYYLMHGPPTLSYDQALEIIRSRRPVARPNSRFELILRASSPPPPPFPNN